MSPRGIRLLRTLLALSVLTVVAVYFAARHSDAPVRFRAGRSSSAVSSPRPRAHSASSVSAASSVPEHLVVAPAPWHLPNPVSSEVVLAKGGSLLVAGGLTASDTSSSGVFAIDPTTGALRLVGTLAAATHDAAGAVIGGDVYVFGGGTALTTANVQRLIGGAGSASIVAQLPQPRSDVSGAVSRGRVYLAGGYDGTTFDPQVLESSDGQHFQVLTSLPVPVRYPAVAVVGGNLLVVGGMNTAGVPVNDVQVVDLATGAARVDGALPVPLAHATGVVLGGRAYVAGGVTASGARSAAVYWVQPGSASRVGLLPVAVSDAGAAVIGGVGYLIGGYTAPLTSTTEVATLRLSSGG
ncbi:MAG: Kelch repeat-containing protein [Mycobacteriales bacterium]